MKVNLERLFSTNKSSRERAFDFRARPPRNRKPSIDKASKEQTELIAENLENQAKEEDDDDDGLLNKETSEIGRPRKPEPTRCDWERNGRSSDFFVSFFHI
ncbi:hypothetical protein DVH24_009296 [Malus domestica]|uniref:Succinate dehydrogenase assembly factor 4, mitochondrial n=1 Tax=Malus domestica TaxID=3750 RepID=A0A498ITH2_MALDO|nr:hypothetical protein DVH24_009296 [Malus domestica]